MNYSNFVKIAEINNNEKIKISPYLFLYKSQFTSFFSIFLRVSGGLLSFYLLFFILNYNSIFFSNKLNYLIFEFFFNFDFFENLYLTYTFIIFLLYFFLYHLFFGLRVWVITNKYNIYIFQKLLELKVFYRLNFIIFYVIIFFLVQIILLFFIL